MHLIWSRIDCSPIFHVKKVKNSQGDQIGRIVAYILGDYYYFSFLNISKEAKSLGLLIPLEKDVY
jgi:hypothetical protein